MNENLHLTKAYILLGGNLGNILYNFNESIIKINEKAGVVVQKSDTFKSEPWGFDTENDFINQVIMIKTKLSAIHLLNTMKEIEITLGRKRGKNQFSSRNIDLDLLFYGNQIIETDELTIPHPRLHLRRFTLVPLKQIAPDLLHPVLNKTVDQLLKDCKDKGKVSLH